MSESQPSQPSQPPQDGTPPPHPGYPPYPGRPPYPGYPPYPGQPPYPGYPPYPGQPPYPGYAPYPGRPAKGPGLALAALAGSVVALLLCLVPVIKYLAFVLALVSLLLGGLAWASAGRGRRTGQRMAVAAVILSVLAATGVIISRGDSTDSIGEIPGTGIATPTVDPGELTAAPADVTLGKFKYSKNEFGFIDTSLSVSVVNKGTKTLSFAVIVEAKAPDGELIGTSRFDAENLAPGERTTGTIFKLLSDKDAAKARKATFTVQEITAY